MKFTAFVLKYYKHILNDYTYNDLITVIQNKEYPFYIIASDILTHKLNNTCTGCLYDKCDQESHMGPNGCLESSFEELNLNI